MYNSVHEQQCHILLIKNQGNNEIINSTNSNLEENVTQPKPASNNQYIELNKNYGIKIKADKYYSNMYEFKSVILKENKNKSGIYKFTNKLNGNFYIGNSINLSRRFTNYYSLSYISTVKNHLTASHSRAFIKYGYVNFELEILEYCEKINLLKREQYYIDSLKPIYNIAKIAGSSLGILKTKEQKDNISKALKGKYVGKKSALFGRTHNSETKKLMSLAKSGINNPLYGKTHSNESKEIMRAKKLNNKLSEVTKEKIKITKGQAVYLYNLKDNTNTLPSNFILIKKFNSIRELSRFFNVSNGTISKYLRSGKIFKNYYLISNKSEL